MTDSRLAVFIRKLAIGLRVSDDPFDDDYFEVKHYLKEREAEEEDLAALAIAGACWKRENVLKGKKEREHNGQAENPREQYYLLKG